MKRRSWKAAERAMLRRDYARRPAALIAARLKRTKSQVYQQAAKLGLSKNPHLDWGELDADLRRLHADGWSDAEIAQHFQQALGRYVSREAVGDRRRTLRLKHNAFSDHRRRRVAARTREQLARAGISKLGYLRVVAWSAASRRCGWPGDLRPRAVQILNLLYERGPLTRRQIAEAIGMPWKGSRKTLVSNDREGTYLWNLVNRGLVVRLPRLVKGVGKGRSQHLYTLALGVAPHFEQEAS